MEVWWPPIKVYFTPFINMTLRVLEAFSGVGSQRMALRNLGIDHEVVAIAEIDKFAIKSYEAIHGETFNLGDVSQVEIDDIPDHDLFTYSFPCQDISVAGNGLGLDEGSGTRSGLLWECQKIIVGKNPKYLLLENVKNLVGKRHRPNFDKWLEWLEDQGYTNYWQVLNAKNYGVPQNRERVFVVSIFGEHEPYEFPEPIELTTRLKDVLESEVDEKFYLSDERVGKLMFRGLESKTNVIATGDSSSYEQNNRVYDIEKESLTITSRDYKDPKRILEPQINQVAQYNTPTRKNSNRFRTNDENGIAPTIGTMGGGGHEPQVLIKNGTKKGYLEATHGDGVDLAYPDSKARRGRVQKGLIQTLDTSDSKGVVIAASRGRNPENPSDRTVGSSTEQRLEINKQGTSNTITTVQKDNYVLEGVDVHPFSKKLEFRGYKQKEVSPCLLATDYKAPKTILESQTNSSHAQKDNYVVEPSDSKGVIEKIGNIYPSGGQNGNVFETKGISPTISSGSTSTKGNGGIGSNNAPKILDNFRIRKLTPLECWRLMGFSDEDFHKAESVNSNTQLYKQAGNSIVVDVLESIFKQLFKEAHNESNPSTR